MSQFNLAQFGREVRQEVNKITWPTRQETVMSVIMVCVMAILAALYFVGVDNIIRYVIRLIMGI